MATKQVKKEQPVKKEELVKTEQPKRDNSQDIALMMACIMRTLDEIKRYVDILVKYDKLDHGGEL